MSTQTITELKKNDFVFNQDPQVSTRIITLMFHRVNHPSQGYCPLQFKNYLEYLVQHFPIVVPGDSLPKAGIAVCLTFDDAYFDFYHTVFPLLKKHHIKAILAVPVSFICESTQLPSEKRLQVPYPQGLDITIAKEKVPFCTWEELREMADSQHVVMASHGYAHENLANDHTPVVQEISKSREILQDKLNIPIRYFVYPYGKYNDKVHAQVSQTYDFGIRIGSALNFGWNKENQFIYRIDAEPLWLKNKRISHILIEKWSLKYWGNRIRKK